ncbi:MAG: hypothetical protein AAGE80_06565 [Pseudomonadota bacterium]
MTTPPPPSGLVRPSASDTLPTTEAGTEAAQPASFQIPSEGQLAALKITIENPPEDLLDEQGAGILTLRQKGRRDADRLIFLNGSLNVFALDPGIYRIDAIGGYRCGELFLILPPREEPLALGHLTLTPTGEKTAMLSGGIPAPEDLENVAALIGATADEIASQPLERRQGIRCERVVWAASRPDIDPNARVLTPLEVAEGVLFLAVLGAISGGAIATGSFVFASGSGGAFVGASF